MTNCNVCSQAIKQPIYVSKGDISITSLNQIFLQKTEVFFCENCGHLQTNEIGNLEDYYDQNYKIFISDDDEDLLYKIVDGRKVFRLEHQSAVFLEKIKIPQNAVILDYGCAKSAAFKKLLEVRPDITPHLFDVSEAYIPFWEKFVDPNNWATYSPKAEWVEKFDVVSSFFSLEHVANPHQMVSTIKSLLKPGGQFFCIVPNVFSNTADFIVLDHVNHFSESSFRFLLEVIGFDNVTIDSDAHDGAIVAVGIKPLGDQDSQKAPQLDRHEVSSTYDKVSELARYWSAISDSVRDFETHHAENSRVAIYGSGFYGTFIATCLRSLDKVECFVDQSQFRQGKTLFDKPIVAPENLDPSINTIYVGLNPRIARNAIDQIENWRSYKHEYFYL